MKSSKSNICFPHHFSSAPTLPGPALCSECFGPLVKVTHLKGVMML